MGRTIARIVGPTLVAGIALAGFLYGVVLNGFGLFGPTGNTTALSRNASPREITTRVDPGVAGARGPAPKSEPAEAVASAPPEPRAARDVTPPNVLARPTSRYRDPTLVEKKKEEAQAEEPPTRRYHQVVVKDPGTLESGGVTVRFAGVAPIGADRTCKDEAGRQWPCGRVATAALRMLIRHRAVDCTVVSQTPDGIVGTCSTGLQDIGGWLVEQGWAEDSSGAYPDQAKAARDRKRGIHLAEWGDKDAAPTDALSLTAFTAPQIPAQAYSAPPATDTAVPADGDSEAAGGVVAGPGESPVDQGTGLVDPVQGDE